MGLSVKIFSKNSCELQTVEHSIINMHSHKTQAVNINRKMLTPQLLLF